jgi:hypothetical protein
MLSKASYSLKIQGMIIGVLSKLCGQFVSRLPFNLQRQNIVQIIAQFLLNISPNVFDLFDFIFHAKHLLYLKKKQQISTNVNKMISQNFKDILETKSSLHYVAFELLDRHIESNSDVYCDAVSLTVHNSDVTMRSVCSGRSLDALVVSQSITDDDVVSAYQKYTNHDSNAERSIFLHIIKQLMHSSCS